MFLFSLSTSSNNIEEVIESMVKIEEDVASDGSTFEYRIIDHSAINDGSANHLHDTHMFSSNNDVADSSEDCAKVIKLEIESID